MTNLFLDGQYCIISFQTKVLSGKLEGVGLCLSMLSLAFLQKLTMNVCVCLQVYIPV